MHRQISDVVRFNEDDPTKPNLANDFAWLPNEIIHDILQLASFEIDLHRLALERITTEDDGDAHFEKLALTESFWADFAKEFWNLARTNRSLELLVWCLTDFQRLRAILPYCYDYLCVNDLPEDGFCGILKSIPTQFSSIHWNAFCHRYSFTFVLVQTFLERQLRSKHLRTLRISRYIDLEELNGLFVDFVKRPQFEALKCFDLLPFEVFEAAHRTWEATERFVVKCKTISSTISEETFKKLKNYFKRPLSVDGSEVCWEHPVHCAAVMNLRVLQQSEGIGVLMEFQRLQQC